MKEQLLQYWSGLEHRERVMVAVGGIAIALTLLYLAIVEPLLNYRGALESEVNRKRETVAWMQQAADQLAQRPANVPAGNVDTGSLLTLVDSSARNALLGDSLERVQQSGSEAVRVSFENAVFDDLLLWLGGLNQQYGVRVEEITLERADAPGRVDANLSLARGGEQS